MLSCLCSSCHRSQNATEAEERQTVYDVSPAKAPGGFVKSAKILAGKNWSRKIRALAGDQRD